MDLLSNNKKKKVIYISVGAFLLIALIVFLIFLLNKSDTKQNATDEPTKDNPKTEGTPNSYQPSYYNNQYYGKDQNEKAPNENLSVSRGKLTSFEDKGSYALVTLKEGKKQTKTTYKLTVDSYIYDAKTNRILTINALKDKKNTNSLVEMHSREDYIDTSKMSEKDATKAIENRQTEKDIEVAITNNQSNNSQLQYIKPSQVIRTKNQTYVVDPETKTRLVFNKGVKVRDANTGQYFPEEELKAGDILFAYRGKASKEKEVLDKQSSSSELVYKQPSNHTQPSKADQSKLSKQAKDKSYKTTEVGTIYVVPQDKD